MTSNDQCGLIGIAYLPHGTMLLDPDRGDLPILAKSLHSTCMQISTQIAELNPDLLLLLTPHGLNVHHSINIYQPGISNCYANGNAQWNGQWTDYSVDIDLDGEASKELYLYLKERLSNVQGMLSFAGLSTPLRWGEVVPLYFALHELARRNQNVKNNELKQISMRSKPKVVIIAQPGRGVTSTVEYIVIRLDWLIRYVLAEEKERFYEEQQPNLIKFGQSIRSWCDQSSKRILLVISGDQAHTHAWSSQLPQLYQPDPSCFSRFPQSGTEQADLFDEMIQNWLTGKRSQSNNNLYQLDEDLLVNQAGKIEKQAISCGYAGSLTLQGVMKNDFIQNRIEHSSQSIDSSAHWILTNFSACCPTYYGMLAALFLRNNK